MIKNSFRVLALAIIVLMACNTQNDEPLPILGNKDIVDGDTIYHTVRDFEFIDQDSQLITPATFADKIYIADFFFISCPTICPKVKKQMLRIQQRFGDNPELMMISHTVDTKRDTVARLKAYSEKIGINTAQWKLVTGIKDSIYSIADDYFSVAVENPEAPGGFDHSGRLILVDKKKMVRSFCDGTDPKAVDKFMEDIDKLLAEQ